MPGDNDICIRVIHLLLVYSFSVRYYTHRPSSFHRHLCIKLMGARSSFQGISKLGIWRTEVPQGDLWQNSWGFSLEAADAFSK